MCYNYGIRKEYVAQMQHTFDQVEVLFVQFLILKKLVIASYHTSFDANRKSHVNVYILGFETNNTSFFFCFVFDILML